MDLDFRVSGDRKLLKAFDRLGAVGQAAALGTAAQEGADPLIRAAQGRAPTVEIGEGVQLIEIEVNNRGKVTAKVGLPGGRKPWFHGLFIERGTGPRVRKSGGRTGSMPASPWMRPAFESAKKQAQAAFARTLRLILEREARG